MEDDAKGTVTSLGSLYRAEEARKAAKVLEDNIAEKHKELHNLNFFVSDNTNLIRLVQRLPEELSHNVMVPFGKAAFFPGRLIHTNEFLVLLGEGYYAERTSKQTVEILQRRGKALESQVDSLKAMVEDLRAEASFFLDTAAEAAEGVVEIREEYIEEHPIENLSNQAGFPNVESSVSSEDASVRVDNDEDEEYARIMAKLDELEKEELAAESADKGDEEHHFDWSLKMPEKPEDSKMQLEDSKIKHVSKDKSLTGNDVALNMETSNIVEKAKMRPEAKEKGPGAMTTTDADSKRNIIGSIVEHATHNIETRPVNQSSFSSQPTGSNPSKPVSRFKMQRAGR